MGSGSGRTWRFRATQSAGSTPHPGAASSHSSRRSRVVASSGSGRDARSKRAGRSVGGGFDEGEGPGGVEARERQVEGIEGTRRRRATRTRNTIVAPSASGTFLPPPPPAASRPHRQALLLAV